MTPRVQSNHYRVGWKFKSRQNEVADYAFPTVAELLRHLYRSEGVTTLSVDELFVHQILPDGNILELIAIDNKDKVDIETERPTVRRRPARSVRRRQLTEAMMIGTFTAPTAQDRDDYDIIPWPPGMTDEWDLSGDGLLTQVTEILGHAKRMREKPKNEGTPISVAMYTAYPAIATE